jgi:hypothetical protein
MIPKPFYTIAVTFLAMVFSGANCGRIFLFASTDRYPDNGMDHAARGKFA